MKTFLKDCRWGRFLLLRGDMISIFADLYGEWSELELRLFQKFLAPDSNIVEVGANLGLHSVPLAKFAGRGKVICFEPQRIVFQLLCANVALNDLTNVFAYNIAVSDEERELAIQSSDYETPWNYGAFSLAKGMSTEGSYPGPVASESVTAIRLDTFRPVTELPSIALLKIDAESHELAVLEGAAGQIARHRPVIFLENNSEQHGDVLIRRVESFGYRPYWFCDERYQPDNFNRVGIKVPGFDVNMICFPAERDSYSSYSGLMRATTFSDLKNGKVPLVKRVA